MTTQQDNQMFIEKDLGELVSLGDAPSQRGQELRARLSTYPLEDYARVLRKLKDEHEELKTKAASIWKLYETAAQQIVPALMTTAGVKTMNVEGAGRLQLDNMMNVSIINKDQGYEWLREHGLGDIIVPTVNSSTLKATMKDWLKKGHALPPEDVVSVAVYQQAKVVRV